MRLAILFRVPPSRIDEVMSGADAMQILRYLNKYPEVEDVVDIQLARLMQMIGQAFGGKVSAEEIILRGSKKTEEEIAEDWIRWIDERENVIANKF